MKNRIFAGLLAMIAATVILLSLFACGGNSTEDTSGKQDEALEQGSEKGTESGENTNYDEIFNK